MSSPASEEVTETLDAEQLEKLMAEHERLERLLDGIGTRLRSLAHGRDKLKRWP
jgi:hypothetical protein